MKIRWTLLLVLLAAGTVTVSAHHSLTATYDMEGLVSLSGVIRRVEMMNPHATVDLETKGLDGRASTWTIEMAPPYALVRRNVTLQTLGVGQRVVIESWVRKDGTPGANGRVVVLADGTRLDVGDSLMWSPAVVSK
jgi:Family of unknown function (DUF6152)